MLWEWSAQYSYCGMQVLGTLASKVASLLIQAGRGHVWNCALTLQSIAQKWRSVNPSYILLAKASHIPRKSWNRISVNSSKWQPQELTMNLLIYKQVNSSQTFVFSLLTSINDVGNSSTSHPSSQPLPQWETWELWEFLSAFLRKWETPPFGSSRSLALLLI